MNDNKAIVTVGVVGIIALVLGATISSFAPDTTAARIAACMQQPNMEYRQNGSCMRVNNE